MTEYAALLEALTFSKRPDVLAEIQAIRTSPGTEEARERAGVGYARLFPYLAQFEPTLLTSPQPDLRDIGRYLLEFVPRAEFRTVGRWVEDNEYGIDALAEFIVAASLAGARAERNSPSAKVAELCDVLALPDSIARRARVLLGSVAAAPPVPIAQASAPSGITTIVVHGTWAATTTWWREQPGTANFWDYIDRSTSGVVGGGNEFSWSGGNTDADRRQGARDLLNWRTMNPAGDLQVIAHSHGMNVVFFAAALDSTFVVKNFIALGGPMRIEYLPQMANIKQLHNIYSEHDSVQPLGAVGGQRGEGRTVGDSQASVNHHVPYWSPTAWGVRAVGHSDLHEEQVWVNNGLSKLLL